jgi:hypothetical protein
MWSSMECTAGALVAASIPGTSFIPEEAGDIFDMSWDDMSMPGMESELC